MASEGEAGSAAATETEPGEGYGSFVSFTVLSEIVFTMWRKKHFHSTAKRYQHANLSIPQSNQASLMKL